MLLHTAIDVFRKRTAPPNVFQKLHLAAQIWLDDVGQHGVLEVDGVLVAAKTPHRLDGPRRRLTFEDFWSKLNEPVPSALVPHAPSTEVSPPMDLGRLSPDDHARVLARLRSCHLCPHAVGVCVLQFPGAKGKCHDTLRRMAPGFISWLAEPDAVCPTGRF